MYSFKSLNSILVELYLSTFSNQANYLFQALMPSNVAKTVSFDIYLLRGPNQRHWRMEKVWLYTCL